MKDTLDPDRIPFLLARVGEILQDRGASIGIVVVGGAALNLLGVIHRSTVDVDVIALGGEPVDGVPVLTDPGELPEELKLAAARVARDYTLPARWVNAEVASQWRTGLPPGFAGRVEWRRFGGLSVGLAGRWDLIALKLYAAADHDSRSRHLQDLLSLRPTPEELSSAGTWVRGQDAGEGFSAVVDQVIAHVTARTG